MKTYKFTGTVWKSWNYESSGGFMNQEFTEFLNQLPINKEVKIIVEEIDK